MDSMSIIQLTIKFWWALPLLLIIALLKKPRAKGSRGEAKVNLMGRLLLPKRSYHRLNNITLPTLDGTTQIDHIIVSRFGIFVVETKHMKGWILGTERQAQWTQKFRHSAFRFQNPLRQNYRHVKALQSLLDVPPVHIHSLVVFVGKSRLKTSMPPNVTKGLGYIRYIRSFRTKVLSESQVQDVIEHIQNTRLAPTRRTDRAHVKRLKKQRAKRARQQGRSGAQRLCPKCGKSMVLRTARRGVHTGQQFWGCSGFPQCTMIVDA